MKIFRAYYRLFGFAIIVFRCIVPVMLRSYFVGQNLAYGLKKRQLAAQRLVRFLGVKIKPSGNIVNGNYLYIANHRSYFDPVLVAFYVPILAVAKAEVRSWPLLGYGTQVTGTIYVERENKESRSDSLRNIRQALKDGFPVMIFPEGTSSDEKQTLPFRRGSFKVASEEGISVVPITIEYENKGNAFIGKDTFLPHFIRCFSKKETTVFLHFGEKYYDENAENLLEKIKQNIDNQLLKLN
jgi:lyso-ornithine lipid O-acyltransferase